MITKQEKLEIIRSTFNYLRPWLGRSSGGGNFAKKDASNLSSSDVDKWKEKLDVKTSGKPTASGNPFD